MKPEPEAQTEVNMAMELRGAFKEHAFRKNVKDKPSNYLDRLGGGVSSILIWTQKKHG